ncbi:hypothetical protein Taro_007152 [Colocasia esculenta]|uniref:Uncharacterized protein n=1 Tax=Colocasia esculenta TaxID=4460 RepID=A0A843TUN8_COLES|nr:hypothetical protein [Colocasia esculenta]
MQTQAHTQAALQAQLEAQERADVWWASLLRTRFEDGAIDVAWDEFPSRRTRLVAFDHRTVDEALSAACRQEGEMEQYLEEKKASQKRHVAPFQRQDKKKAVYQSPQLPMAASSTQMKDFDAILGLDWLEEHYALVDRLFGGLRRLEDSLNIEEHFPDSGVQRDLSQSPDLGGFGGFLALAEDSFSEPLIPLLIFPEASLAGDPTSLEEIVESDSERGE